MCLRRGRFVTSAYAFDGAKFRPLDWEPPRTLRWAAWRADGEALLAAGNGGCVMIWDGSQLRPLQSNTRQNFRGVAWSPDGGSALLAGNGGAVFRLRGEAIEELESPTSENLRRVAWHPDGTYALIVGNNGVVLRYAEASGALAPLPADRAHTLRAVAFRLDGAYALVGAYASRHAGYPRPHPLYRCDGRYLQSVLASDDEDDLVSIDWSRDSTALVSGYAWLGDGSLMNKALLFDGSAWQTRAWASKGVVLGGAWRPGGEDALLVGEGGLAMRLDGDGELTSLESGLEVSLVGPFWKPDGEWALALRGPDERVYTV
jgi:WD40 repeat protein